MLPVTVRQGIPGIHFIQENCFFNSFRRRDWVTVNEIHSGMKDFGKTKKIKPLIFNFNKLTNNFFNLLQFQPYVNINFLLYNLMMLYGFSQHNW